MQGDIQKSVGAAVIIIVILFWWAHRRLRPLLWLLTLLALIIATTLAIGGLVFGTVNVVSVGFAAILLGLSVDYALVLYQEARHSPGVPTRELRRRVLRGIIWSAATTAAAFAILNFGGLPGLAQLGSLVAIGIVVAAYVMSRFFLSPLTVSLQPPGRPRAPSESESESESPSGKMHSIVGWTMTASLGIIAIAILFRNPPALDHTTHSLRPKESASYATMEAIKTNLARGQEPDWLIVAGRDEAEVANRLAGLKPILEQAEAAGEIIGFTLPDALAPRPAFQTVNRGTAAALAEQWPALQTLAHEKGFTAESLALTGRMLSTWHRAALNESPFWPTNSMSRWVMNQMTTREPEQVYALGLVYARPGHLSSGKPESWVSKLPTNGVWLAGWERLGNDLLVVVEDHLWYVLLPMAGLLLCCLWLAFRRLSEVALSIFTLLFSTLCLWATMGVLGWSWNLMNLLALPLLLGAGVDYSIHMQLGLRRHGGNVKVTRLTIGRAILLCAATTATGFGSNALSSNAGVESLGLVCAVGIACTFFTSFFLLPVWWRSFATAGKEAPDVNQPGHSNEQNLNKTQAAAPGTAERQLSAPSSLYRQEFWMLGLGIVRVVPRPICLLMGHAVATIYWRLAAQRREVVIQNLLPAVNQDRQLATATARRLLHQFVIKVVDLWRYEAGLPIQNSFGSATGWEHFAAALAEKRGVLLLTPHLGNWEFGGPWLTQKGVPLQVVTLAEPGANFTQLRQASRARWNIETLVIGNDPFAFVEIIRRLEAGAVVALLVDRPSLSTSVTVELFRQPFPASIAAAELARAAGCVLLPVFLPREGDTYAAHVLPPISYDRATLRDPAARQALTQQIMRAFEPAIQQHLDQWYHFIPVWPPRP